VKYRKEKQLTGRKAAEDQDIRAWRVNPQQAASYSWGASAPTTVL